MAKSAAERVKSMRERQREVAISLAATTLSKMCVPDMKKRLRDAGVSTTVLMRIVEGSK